MLEAARRSSSTPRTSGLWVCPRARHPDYIRAHVDDIVALLKGIHRIADDGRPANLLRVPPRLHWLLWLMGDQLPLDG